MNSTLFKIIISGILLAIFAAPTSAKSMYVTDVLKLTVRSGPGAQYKVIAVINSGEKIQVLESKEDWSLVQASERMIVFCFQR